jgi:anaerobic ribonucleoside-triphosphate reductase activating protein
MMFIHNKLSPSTANGPGERAVVWFQGCNLKCPGCWNAETHRFDPKKDTSLFDLADWILEQGVEGVTFSGGEPFQQALSLELLLTILRDEKPALSIGSFTGYTLKELREGKFSWWHPALSQMLPGDAKLSTSILKQMDFIIAGRYNQDQRCEDKPLCGSRNQIVHFLSDRYSAKDLTPNTVEILVDKDTGLVQLTGFPNNLGVLEDAETARNTDNNDDDGRLVGA